MLSVMLAVVLSSLKFGLKYSFSQFYSCDVAVSIIFIERLCLVLAANGLRFGFAKQSEY